jgi:predicted esterase
MKGQTLSQRKAQVKDIIAFTDELIRKNKVKVIVDKRTGAVAFDGMTPQERGNVSDACTYRVIMATGSALAKQAIARAEQLAGRTVNRQALTAGVHSHDGGHTWSSHKH